MTNQWHGAGYRRRHAKVNPVHGRARGRGDRRLRHRPGVVERVGRRHHDPARRRPRGRVLGRRGERPARPRRDVDRRLHRRRVQRRRGLVAGGGRVDRAGDRLDVHADLRRPAVARDLRRGEPHVLARPGRRRERGRHHGELRLGGARRHPGRARPRGRHVRLLERRRDRVRARLDRRRARGRLPRVPVLEPERDRVRVERRARDGRGVDRELLLQRLRERRARRPVADRRALHRPEPRVAVRRRLRGRRRRQRRRRRVRPAPRPCARPHEPLPAAGPDGLRRDRAHARRRGLLDREGRRRRVQLRRRRVPRLDGRPAARPAGDRDRRDRRRRRLLPRGDRRRRVHVRRRAASTARWAARR